MNTTPSKKSELEGPPVQAVRGAAHGHTVQFYWEDAHLLATLSDQISDALATGVAAIVIATPKHRETLAQQLNERGLDVACAAREGRYIALDAADTLAKFMVDGWPDKARFDEAVGNLVHQTATAANGLVAFGEMVALLWERGMSQGALRLESLWNDLIRKYSFTLHCAYPMSTFAGQKDTEGFQNVCDGHSAVIPATNDTGQYNEESYRRALANTQQAMQALENERVLRQAEQRYRMLVESVQDYAIFMLDSEGRVNTWNEGARRIKGYDAVDIIGRHFSCFYPDEDIRAGKPQKGLEIAARTGRLEDEGWRLRQDGSRFWANVTITALRDASGVLHGFCKVTRDTTDKMRAQESLQKNRDALKKEVDERIATEAKLQESEASLRVLSRSLFHVQDEERRHLGRELHDSIGQYLSALKMGLDSLQFEPALQEKAVRQQLEGSIGMVEQCIKEVRTMSYLLYPPLLEEMGLRMAIPWYIDGFAERSGIKTRLQMPRDFGRLPRDVELVLFRVLQEGLTNVHRHSGSTTALIRVFVENESAVIEIVDVGKGLPTGVLESGQKGAVNVGIGLRGMKERVTGIGGKLELSSAGSGTTVRATIPCSAAPPAETKTIH